MNKTAVLVVHGVGETEPGATVDALVSALAAAHPNMQQDGAPKVLWLPDPPPPDKHWSKPDAPETADELPPRPNDPHFGKVYPVHTRSATLYGSPYEFFEVYWADLSRVRDGWLNLLLGLFYFNFDVRHLARAAADQQEGWGAPFMRWVVTCVGQLLLRVIAPLTAFLGLTLAACALLVQFQVKVDQITKYGDLIMGILGAVALGLGFFWALVLRTRSEPWTWFCSSSAFVGLFVLALAVMSAARETFWEWLIPMLLIVVFAFCYWRRSYGRHPIRVAFLIEGVAAAAALLLVLDSQIQQNKWLKETDWSGNGVGLFKGLDWVVQSPFGSLDNPAHVASIVGAAAPPPGGPGLPNEFYPVVLAGYIRVPIIGPAWYAGAILVVINLVYLVLMGLMLLGLVDWVLTGLRRGVNHPVAIALGAAYSAAVAQIALWVFISYVLFALAQKNGWAEPLTRYTQSLNDWTLFVVFTSFALLVAVVAWATWVFRNWWSSRIPPTAAATPYDRNRPVPRLLMGWGIQVSLVAAWILGCVIYVAYLGFIDLPDAVDDWLHIVSQNNEAIMTVLVSFLVVGAGFLAKPLAAGLHIVMDVINHFNYQDPQTLQTNERWQELSKVFQKGNLWKFLVALFQWLFFPALYAPPPPAPAAPSRANEPGYERRRRIAARLRSVLDRVLQDPQVRLLRVVAHSQGTLISINVLNDPTVTAAIGAKRFKALLITMGSPITHLYQHYFPRQYPPLNAADWNELRQNVAHWVNIFRIDDFVGTHVDGGLRVGNVGPWLDEFPLDAGGHTYYWNQHEVTDKLIRYL